MQLYLHQRYGSASRPVRELKGFRRVTLQPGEKQEIKFPHRPRRAKLLERREKWLGGRAVGV